MIARCGVEVSSDAIKYVVLRGRRLAAYGRVPLGEIGSPIGVLLRLRETGRLGTRDLRVALGTQSSILRILSLPPMPATDLSRVVRGEVEKEQQLFTEEMAFGHQAFDPPRRAVPWGRRRAAGLGPLSGPGGLPAGRTPVLIALTARAGLASFEREAAAAGFRLPLLTTTSLALLGHVRSLSRLARGGEADAVLHLETDRMVLAVVQEGSFRQLRDLGVGLDSSLLEQQVSTGTDDSADAIDWDALDQIGRGLDEVTQVARQIRRTLEADAASANARPIRRLLLTGDVTRGEAMAPLLQNEVGLPVEVLNPLEDLRVEGAGEDFRREAASYALPLALAKGPGWMLHLGAARESRTPAALWLTASALAVASLVAGRMAAPYEERAQVRALEAGRTHVVGAEDSPAGEAALRAWIEEAGRGPREPLEWISRKLPPSARTSSIDLMRRGREWSVRCDGALYDRSTQERLRAWAALSDSLRADSRVSGSSLLPLAGEVPSNRSGVPLTAAFRFGVEP